eukprot:4244018-Alexandrium_andersonii.AAC.1
MRACSKSTVASGPGVPKANVRRSCVADRMAGSIPSTSTCGVMVAACSESVLRSPWIRTPAKLSR